MQNPEDFESFIANERRRLDGQRNEVLSKKAALDEQLQAIDRELEAITAYETVKTGKSAASAPQQVRRRTGRRSGRRQEVLELLGTQPEGFARRDILERLGVKGDRSQEQSVSNALSALKKGGQVRLENGRYTAS